jgi:folate-binding protein YgfZ
MTPTFDDVYRVLHGDAVWADRSTRDARIEVCGPDASEWLHGLLTQDIRGLHPGRGGHAAYLTPQGRMVADLRVFHRGEAFLLETVAATRDTLLGRLDQFVIMEDVTISDVTDALGVVTILGPLAAAAASACTGIAAATLDGLPEHGHMPLDGAGAFIAASREFGVPAFDLFAPPEDLGRCKAMLEDRIPMAPAELLETARIEAGRPRFGVDMHDDTIPLEAGLEARAISLEKGCYVGQEVIIRILHRGQGRVARRLVWVAHAPYGSDAARWTAGEAVHLSDKPVGSITSACWSPARGGLLGIAMLHRDATEPGTTVRVGARDAIVTRLP